MAYWAHLLLTYFLEIILLKFHISLRSQLKNLCLVFHQGCQTPQNNKSTLPSASCFHPFLSVWNLWWKTRIRFLTVIQNSPTKKGTLTGLKLCFCNSVETQNYSLAQAVDIPVMMAGAMRIYILLIKVNKRFFFYCHSVF